MENINEEANLREYFLNLLSKSEIKVPDEKITQMLKFLELLYNKNQIMNLTAIREKKGMLEKHFIDSLLLTKVINDDEKSFIDVGTGAGFPGLVLAEELIKDRRESFDVALCRGVANLRIILEYMIPFIKVNGRFLPQKLNLNEIEESKNALKILNAKINKTFEFNLPESMDKRIILEILKLQKTEKKYPRKIGIPSKKPL